MEKNIIQTAPKKCMVRLTLSKKVDDNSFIKRTLDNHNVETPFKLNKLSDKEFTVEVGTNFKRCTDCCLLVRKLRDQVDNNTVMDKGTCTFEDRTHKFSYEDYFD